MPIINADRSHNIGVSIQQCISSATNKHQQCSLGKTIEEDGVARGLTKSNETIPCSPIWHMAVLAVQAFPIFWAAGAPEGQPEIYATLSREDPGFH